MINCCHPSRWLFLFRVVILAALMLAAGTTEYWSVPATSPTTISALRSTVMPASIAIQVASRQYVDSALAAKANNSSVVHVTGSEQVTGTKQFTAPPVVPAPVGGTDAANKAYVDSAVT